MSIQKAIGDNVLTCAEFQTVLYEIANLVNSRPIGAKPGCNLSSNLTPNDLLIGRNDRYVPSGTYDDAPSRTFDENTPSKARYRFLQTVVTGFLKKWLRYYFPMLMVQKKWHFQKMNVQVGDIALV